MTWKFYFTVPLPLPFRQNWFTMGAITLHNICRGEKLNQIFYYFVLKRISLATPRGHKHSRTSANNPSIIRPSLNNSYDSEARWEQQHHPTFRSDWAARGSSSLDSPPRSPCRRGSWRMTGQKAGRETGAAGRLRSSRYRPAACSRWERAGSCLRRTGRHDTSEFPPTLLQYWCQFSKSNSLIIWSFTGVCGLFTVAPQ